MRVPTQDQHREIILAELRAGVLRARLAAAELEEIGLAVAYGMVDPSEARAWCRYCFDAPDLIFLDDEVQQR